MAKTTKDDPRTEPRTTRNWTIMVYMVADKSADLDAIAVQDLREMERGGNGSAHVVVQINRAWPDSFQRYEIRAPKAGERRGSSFFISADDGASDMGKEKTLADFLDWAPRMFPAEQYFLVLWGHAFGLGFGRDHNDELTLTELASGLKAFRIAREETRKKYKIRRRETSAEDGRIELLGTNACAMSYVEAAYQLRNSAQYMVASQISVPFAGWPYESILRRVPDATGPADLGRLVLDLYVGHYNSLIRGERVAMSLLNLQNLEKPAGGRQQQAGYQDLKKLIERFAKAIRSETQVKGQFGGKGRGPVRDVFIGAAAGDVRPLIDLTDLCNDFNDADSDELRNAAQELRLFLDGIIVHRDQHPDLEDLNGIGIFAPFVTDEEDLRRLQLLAPEDNNQQNGTKSRGAAKKLTGQDAYEQLDIFGSSATWPRLVFDDLRQEISPELTSTITGIDATTREDRRDVTQIILSIDSAFNKLDRVLAAAKECVDRDLRAVNGGAAPARPAHPAAGSNGHPHRFGLPFLKLIQPIDLETQLETLRQRRDLDALRNPHSTNQAPPPSAPHSLGDGDPELVNTVVDFFTKVENAIGDVEHAARRGLTHPRLGLGPSFPGQFGPDGPPKSGLGPDGPPKSGLGPDGPPKSGLGPDGPPKSGLGDPVFESRPGNGSGDLRVDLALSRVAELFRQVGQSLKALEQATLEVETTARTVLAQGQAQDMSPKDILEAAAQEIGRGFRILEEASGNARRTVRRVLGHPLYGIGPGVAGIGLEERQALAVGGGLDRRNLRLL